MEPIDFARYPQPEDNDDTTVAKALEALRDAHGESSALEATDRFLWAVGNNHAGTYHPVALATLPALEQIVRSGEAWPAHAAMECLIDLGGTFVPEAGYETHQGAPLIGTLRSAVQAIRPAAAAWIGKGGAAAASAGDLVELIDDQVM
jgi:hypothetical protein